MLGIGIARLSLVDGTVEELPRNGIVVIVGPNNSGKSVLLSEINQTLVNGQPNVPSRWVRGIDLVRQGEDEEITAWFHRFATVIPVGMNGAGEQAIWEGSTNPHGPVSLPVVLGSWRAAHGLGRIAHLLTSYHDAMSRGSLLAGVGPRDSTKSQTHPLYRLWDDRSVEASFSELIHEAFGFHVTLNRYSQSPELLIGKPKPRDIVLPTPPTRELLDEYARMVPLVTQGDGVRCFAGLLLHTIGAGVFVTMIDEPEAFLHPPQARLLGRYLREQIPQGGQVILATHSSDVLQGVLDANNDREVKVIRLDVPAGQKVRTLPAERVKTLWRDPLLRYSNMLDGLFHKGIVVCESDGDCRFYSATIDVLLRGESEHDLVFTHVGGKGRLSAALRELNGFGLRAAVIGDLDVLNDKKRVVQLVEAGGGNFAEDFADDLNIVHEQMAGRLAGPTVRVLKDAVKEIVKRADRSPISEQEAESVCAAARTKSGWNEAKRSGIRAFENTAGIAVQRLLRNLKKIGIFLVPVGELERWYIDVNRGHGISYVTAVLETLRYERPTPELAAFMQELVEYFGLRLANNHGLEIKPV